MEELRESIFKSCGIDVLDITRKRESVDARKIFAAIAHRQLKFTRMEVYKFLMKNHAMMTFYLREFDVLIQSDAEFKEMFNKISISFIDFDSAKSHKDRLRNIDEELRKLTYKRKALYNIMFNKK